MSHLTSCSNKSNPDSLQAVAFQVNVGPLGDDDDDSDAPIETDGAVDPKEAPEAFLERPEDPQEGPAVGTGRRAPESRKLRG